MRTSKASVRQFPNRPKPPWAPTSTFFSPSLNHLKIHPQQYWASPTIIWSPTHNNKLHPKKYNSTHNNIGSWPQQHWAPSTIRFPSTTNFSHNNIWHHPQPSWALPITFFHFTFSSNHSNDNNIKPHPQKNLISAHNNIKPIHNTELQAQY